LLFPLFTILFIDFQCNFVLYYLLPPINKLLAIQQVNDKLTVFALVF